MRWEEEGNKKGVKRGKKEGEGGIQKEKARI